jgi:predicted nucleic acid-binding protein
VTAVVVDASAVGALLFGEPGQDAMAARLRGCELHAPPLLAFEIANIAVKKVRRRELVELLALAAVAVFEALPLTITDVTAESCARTALQTGLSAYDAAYLVLARELRMPLVTLDAKMRKAADA